MTADSRWEELALCSQTDPDAFHPEKGNSAMPAKRVCAACEVKPECLDYALTTNQQHGVWGGLSERERSRLKKRAAAGAE